MVPQERMDQQDLRDQQDILDFEEPKAQLVILDSQDTKEDKVP